MLQVNFTIYCRVQEKLSTLTTGYTVEEAEAIIVELKSIEESLRAGQKEKADIVQSLTMLGEDLAAIENEATSQSIIPAIGPREKLSTACQTDICGEVIILYDFLNHLKESYPRVL